MSQIFKCKIVIIFLSISLIETVLLSTHNIIFFYFAALSEGLSEASAFIMLTFLQMLRVLNSLLPTINVLKLTKFPSIENMHHVMYQVSIVPDLARGYNKKLSSTPLSMKFIILINVKMPTIFGF